MDLGDPSFGPKANIDYDKIIYYKSVDSNLTNNWSNVNCSIKD